MIGFGCRRRWKGVGWWRHLFWCSKRSLLAHVGIVEVEVEPLVRVQPKEVVSAYRHCGRGPACVVRDVQAQEQDQAHGQRQRTRQLSRIVLEHTRPSTNSETSHCSSYILPPQERPALDNDFVRPQRDHCGAAAGHCPRQGRPLREQMKGHCSATLQGPASPPTIMILLLRRASLC